MSLPRNQYTKTRTGIVIGGAHINRLPPVTDEHTSLIQQVLLKSYVNPAHAKWANVLYVVLVVAVFTGLFIFVQPTVSAQ